MTSEYGCSQEELTKLMEYRGREALERLQAQYGDVNELCHRLKSSPTIGLSDPVDIERRRLTFGSNLIPPEPIKPFLSPEDAEIERQFRVKLASLQTEPKFSVLRQGQTVQISVAELVVGDICFVKGEDLLPADAVILQSNDLKVDESPLTGETDLVEKGVDRDPLLLSGSYIKEGTGKVVITAVGINSQTGVIMKLLAESDWCKSK